MSYDEVAVRRAFRALGAGGDVIPQVYGREFVESFCARIGLTPDEFGASCQLAPGVVRAKIISAPCQRWLPAWARSIELVLGEGTFDDFAVKFTDRHAAITALARLAFARLLESAGRPTVREYMQALLLTRELKGSSADLSKN